MTNELTYGVGISPNDSAVTSFVSAASITDISIISALNFIVYAAKRSGWWGQCRAIYPFVGGTALSHSYNLKNTAQYTITWNGTLTHSRTGVVGDGVTGYGDTGLNANTVLSSTSAHLSCYSRTNNKDFGYDMGNVNGSTSSSHCTLVLWTGEAGNYGGINCRLGAHTITTLENPCTYPTTGFYLGTRTSSTMLRLFRNDTLVSYNTSSNANVFASSNLGIFARNTTTSGFNFQSNREFAFATIGLGITDQMASDMNRDITTFQKLLNRNV
jgi:hypothetical protein